MRLTRMPAVDEIVVDGELVVMVGDAVLLVGVIGARVLGLVPAEGAEEESVRARIFEEFGVPPDPDGDWRRLLAQLVGWSLLEVTGMPQGRR